MVSRPYYTITLYPLTASKCEWIVNYMTPDHEYIRVASGVSETLRHAQDSAAAALVEHQDKLGALV